MNEMNENSTLIDIGPFNQAEEAYLVRAILDSQGIKSSIDGQHTAGINPLLTNAIGGVRLLISSRDKEDAARILDEFYQKRAAAEANRAKICPKCLCEDGVDIERSVLFGVLAVVTLGIYCLLFPWAKYKCPNCNNKWS
ncbi:MAG TPA: hypothetical protein ENL03_06825 [Phycisphaerae bacterium]|nr:hypothetical protein [Phycisphaerae bacterium]